jgi:predicted enzyme related to lactoylglutathione lyase
MHVVTNYPDGVFNWVDLMSTDVAAAKAFYAGLFGWEADDRPIDGGGFYTMFTLNGKNVAGMGAMSDEMKAQGIPSHWVSYVKHSDVDGVAARVAEAGGTVIMPPMDVMEEGRMMMFIDPTGATVGVWQPKNHIGAQLVNMPNTLVWNELQTRDLEAAKSFFNAVFGWTVAADDTGYVTIFESGRRHAGMFQMGEQMAEIPPNWAVYFFVENVETAVSKVSELGGNVLMPITPAEDIGKFAVAQDPAGAVFTIMEFNGPVDPPPGA